MLPFCGYHMGDYFDHWLDLGGRELSNAPRIFNVNWFRREADGNLWPGFGENMRVLAWIVRRCDDAADARTTPVGYVPTTDALPTDGLDVSREDLDAALAVDPAEWAEEIEPIREFFATFGDKLPGELTRQLDLLAERVEAARR